MEGNRGKWGLSREGNRGMEDNCAEVVEQSMGARNRVGIGLSYRPARFRRLAGWAPEMFKNTGSEQERGLKEQGKREGGVPAGGI